MIADYYNTTVNDYGNIHFQLTKDFIIVWQSNLKKMTKTCGIMCMS